MAEIDELVVKISGDIKELQASLDKAQALAKKAGANIGDDIDKGGKKATSALSALGGAAQVAGGVLVAAGIGKALSAIAAAGRQAAQDYLEFSKAVGEVNSILPKNAKLTDSATNSFIRFAAEFGSTSQGQAKAYYNIVSAGISDQTQALNLLNQANKAAVAGVTDVETAVGALTQVLNVYGSEGLTASEASDILFRTVQQGVTTFSQLQASLGNVIGFAKTAGLGFDEVAGAVGFLTTKGIEGARATTALRGAIVALSAPTDAAKKAAEELGVELGSAALKNNGFEATIKSVVEATGGQLDQVRRLIPEIEGANAIAAIASGDFQNFSDALRGTAQAAGATSDAFREVEETAGFQFDKLVSTLRAIPQLFTNINNEGITDLLITLNETLPSAIEGTLRGFAFLATGVEVVVDSFDALGKTIGTVTGAYFNFTEALASAAKLDFSGAVNKASATIDAFTDQVKENNEEIEKDGAFGSLAIGLEQAANEVSKLGMGLSDLGENRVPAALGGLESLNSGLQTTKSELTDAQKKAQEFALALAGEGEDGQQTGEERLELLRAELEAELLTREEFNQLQLDALRQKFDEERSILEQARADQLVTEEQHTEAVIALEKLQAAEAMKIQKEQEKFKDQQRQLELRQTQNLLGNISLLTRSSAKELVAIGKAAGIANATISTYEAANQALAQGGPFLGPALATSIIIKGLANVAQIASQGAGLQRGIDSVPGIGSRDNFPAVLAPGERVVPTETNKDLTEFLRQQSSEPRQVVVNLNVEGNFFESDDANIKLIERIQDTLKNTGLELT